ncbi:SIS domain-containing protein [Ferruginibacter yonginensis]|uniref:SIS domain-containing protein n=1 Tax=Ferruginibacter yonginensis TaxID=1310416 RepID=A0ABV8QTP2_9BACT
MTTTQQIIIGSAQRTIELQAASIALQLQYINENIIKAVETIATCKGRVVISGIGKSAIIAQKIVATMNSTGTPALFMHAADAIHGDLGMVQQDDVVVVISKSGDSPEIKVLVPLVKNFGNTLIGMVGNMQSYLAAQSDIVLNTTVTQEACPNNLAPTTSTTAQMVMGDVIAICLMELKEFKTADFAKYHPGGALGKKMYLRAGDLIKQHEKPVIKAEDDIKKTILEITKKRLGAVVVLNEKDEVIGIVTDGDVRRMFEKYDRFDGLFAKDIMSSQPKSITTDTLAIHALELMKQNNISQLIITSNGQYEGVLHLHDLVKEGII